GASEGYSPRPDIPSGRRRIQGSVSAQPGSGAPPPPRGRRHKPPRGRRGAGRGEGRGGGGARAPRGRPRRYGDVVALDDLSFSVREGQMFGFVGPNGAGKTTTMRIGLGVLEPGGARVRGGGRPVAAEPRRRFGYMPEERG